MKLAVVALQDISQNAGVPSITFSMVLSPGMPPVTITGLLNPDWKNLPEPNALHLTACQGKRWFFLPVRTADR